MRKNADERGCALIFTSKNAQTLLGRFLRANAQSLLVRNSQLQNWGFKCIYVRFAAIATSLALGNQVQLYQALLVFIRHNFYTFSFLVLNKANTSISASSATMSCSFVLAVWQPCLMHNFKCSFKAPNITIITSDSALCIEQVQQQ